MLVRCPDCTTKYEIAASLIPENGVKVRCPKCKAVFPVSKVAAANGGSTSPGLSIAGRIDPQPQPDAAPIIAPVTAPAAAIPQTSAVASATRPKKKITDPRVAERLARAVLQEVLYARTGERQEALRNQKPLSTFGKELMEAYDVYRERVAQELPGSTATFREAVNDILGEGSKLL